MIGPVKNGENRTSSLLSPSRTQQPNRACRVSSSGIPNLSSTSFHTVSMPTRLDVTAALPSVTYLHVLSMYLHKSLPDLADNTVCHTSRIKNRVICFRLDEGYYDFYHKKRRKAQTRVLKDLYCSIQSQGGCHVSANIHAIFIQLLCSVPPCSALPTMFLLQDRISRPEET